MERKQFSLESFKADTKDRGVFDARVAVFGNVDKVGDRIEKGAFARTLKERGLPPVVWSHQWGIPPIGETLSAKETSAGLEVKCRLFVKDDEQHDVARQVYAGLKSGALREFSFAYDVMEAATETDDGEDIRVLKDLELFEVGPTLVGANPATQLLGAPKSFLESFTTNPSAAESVGRTLVYIPVYLPANEPKSEPAEAPASDPVEQATDEPPEAPEPPAAEAEAESSDSNEQAAAPFIARPPLHATE